ELHRKGLGHELQRNFRRMGRAAHKRTFTWQRDQERTVTAALQWRSNESDQDVDQFFPLSSQRSWHDVGSVCRKDEGDGWYERNGLQGHRLFLQRRLQQLDGRIHRSAR